MSRQTERMIEPTPAISSRSDTDGIVEQPAATMAVTATKVNKGMGSVAQPVKDGLAVCPVGGVHCLETWKV